MTRPDPAAVNFVQAMRRIAIARCQLRGGEEPGLVLEVTANGILTCRATPAGTHDGTPLYHRPRFEKKPLYRTRFEMNGRTISRVDAERAVMGAEVKA